MSCHRSSLSVNSNFTALVSAAQLQAVLLSVFLLYLIVSVNHIVPCGNEHSVAELVALPICSRAKMPKEVHLFCVVIYKVQGGGGGRNVFGVFENVFFLLSLVH